jgi:hypothetical protein
MVQLVYLPAATLYQVVMIGITTSGIFQVQRDRCDQQNHQT